MSSSRPMSRFSRTGALGLLVGLAAAATACKKDAAPAGGESADTTAAGESGDTAAPSGSGRTIEPMRRPVRPGLPGGGEDLAPNADRANGPRGAMRDRVKQFDKDGDGQLSDTEREAMLVARADAMMKRLDVDEDGKITATELEGSPLQRRIPDLSAVDTNGDGGLQPDELAKVITQQIQQGWGGWQGGGRGFGGRGHRRGSNGPESNAPAPTDGDGDGGGSGG
jgi:hypothetical protein